MTQSSAARLQYIIELIDEASKIATEEKAELLLYLFDQSRIEAKYLLDGGTRETSHTSKKSS
jgi:hypothetical protein